MATINRRSGPSLHHHNPFARAMPDDTVIISAMTNPILPKDLAIQQQGSCWKIGMPLLNGWVPATKFSSQEGSTVRDKVLICPFVLVEEETRANPDVPAEEDGAQRVASPVRGSILMFVHGRGPNDFRFILDSGAAVHATPRYYLLKDLVAIASGQYVRAANGKDVQIRGRGRVSLEKFTLDDVDYIPGLISNIVSVSKLTELDYIVQFKGDGCFVRDSRAGDSLVGRGRLVGGVFVLDYLLIPHGRAAAVPQGPASSSEY